MVELGSLAATALRTCTKVVLAKSYLKRKSLVVAISPDIKSVAPSSFFAVTDPITGSTIDIAPVFAEIGLNLTSNPSLRVGGDWRAPTTLKV